MTRFYDDTFNGTCTPADFDPEIQRNYEKMIAAGASEEEAIFFSSKIVDDDYSSVDPELLNPRQKVDVLRKQLRNEMQRCSSDMEKRKQECFKKYKGVIF